MYRLHIRTMYKKYEKSKHTQNNNFQNKILKTMHFQISYLNSCHNKNNLYLTLLDFV